jgi:hypothetical protein
MLMRKSPATAAMPRCLVLRDIHFAQILAVVLGVIGLVLANRRSFAGFARLLWTSSHTEATTQPFRRDAHRSATRSNASSPFDSTIPPIDPSSRSPTTAASARPGNSPVWRCARPDPAAPPRPRIDEVGGSGPWDLGATTAGAAAGCGPPRERAGRDPLLRHLD